MFHQMPRHGLNAADYAACVVRLFKGSFHRTAYLLPFIQAHLRVNPAIGNKLNVPVGKQQINLMSQVVSEDSVRRNFGKLDETEGVQWWQDHLGYCVAPLLSEPWILDADVTVKPLYGHQDGAVKGYNPHKPGCPFHTYHTHFIANLRLGLVPSLPISLSQAMASEHFSRFPATANQIVNTAF